MRYEWVIVGGGVTGIVLSEILTREGHSVLLVDKADQLASETTKYSMSGYTPALYIPLFQTN